MASLDIDKVRGYELPAFTRTYSERDVSLYALAVGAARDPMDTDELQFVYELHGAGQVTLPTFAVTFLAYEALDVPGLVYNPMMLLHGEHELVVHRPLATAGTVTSRATITDVYDKGSGALLLIDTKSTDENGDEVALNRSSAFIRGIGGFGGERGPSTSGLNTPPDREPDAVVQATTRPDQALLYRLASGDRNPLHADPAMAAAGGFQQPILHGLCTFGFAARAVLKTFAGNDPARFRRIKVRFARHVFPGETLVTEMWREGETRVVCQTKVAERDEYCITNAVVELG